MNGQINFGHTVAEREKAFTTLYKIAFPAVAKFVSKRGGSPDDAKDIFQDALVIFYEKITNGFTPSTSAQAYLLGVSKYLWARKFSRDIRSSPLDTEMTDLADYDEPQPSANKLMHYLENTGRKCMELLKAFYYDYLPPVKIAEQFGYSGEHSATVQKYKCMEKVRETVKQKALTYEDFTE